MHRPTAAGTKCSRGRLPSIQRDYGHRRTAYSSSVAAATETTSSKQHC